MREPGFPGEQSDDSGYAPKAFVPHPQKLLIHTPGEAKKGTQEEQRRTQPQVKIKSGMLQCRWGTRGAHDCLGTFPPPPTTSR